MKKMILGCTLIICSVILLSTLILLGFIICNGEGKQSWSFTQYGFSQVITELTWLAVALPLVLLISGISLVISALKN